MRLHDLQLHHGSSTPRFRQLNELRLESPMTTPLNKKQAQQQIELFDDLRTKWQTEQLEKWLLNNPNAFDYGLERAFDSGYRSLGPIDVRYSPDFLKVLYSDDDFYRLQQKTLKAVWLMEISKHSRSKTRCCWKEQELNNFKTFT